MASSFLCFAIALSSFGGAIACVFAASAALFLCILGAEALDYSLASRVAERQHK